MKKCPYCAEEIQDDARICRYCQKELGKTSPAHRRTLYYLASLGLIIGAFLPWATMTTPFGGLSVSGIEGDGIISGVLGLVIGLVALGYADAKKKGLGWTIIVLAGLAELLAIGKIVNLLQVISESDYPGSLGIGLIMTAIAAFLGIAGAINSLTMTLVSNPLIRENTPDSVSE